MSTLLSTLSPAETLMLLDPKSSTGRRLVQSTITHLAFKDVLKISTHKAKIPKTKKLITNYYVQRGSNYGKVPLSPLEKITVTPLEQVAVKAPLPLFAFNVEANMAGTLNSIKEKYVYPSLVDKGLIKKSILNRFFLSFKSTAAGKQLADELQHALYEFNQILSLHFSPSAFINWIGKYGTCFLVGDINYTLLEKYRLTTLQHALDQVKEREISHQAFNEHENLLYEFLFQFLPNPDFNFITFSNYFYMQIDLGFDSDFYTHTA